MEQVTTLPVPPNLFWGAASLIGLVAACFVVFAILPGSHRESPFLLKLRERLGITMFPLWVVVLAGLFWTALAAVLTIGLFGLILDLIIGLAPARENADAVWEFRFKLVQLTALTTVLGAVIALPLSMARIHLSRRANKTQSDALFNDKINEATKGLYARRQITERNSEHGYVDIWEDDTVQRCAAIEQLSRLAALERPSEAYAVCLILSNYIRINFPVENREPTALPFDRRQPKEDLQAAVTSLADLLPKAKPFAPKHWRLDLRYSNLDGVAFQDANFAEADFSYSRLEAANLDNANFNGALFRHALLNCVGCYRTDFTGAQFSYAELSLQPGGWFPNFERCKSLKGANFTAANISGVRRFSAKTLGDTFGTSDTNLSGEMAHRRSQIDLDNFHLYSDATEDEKNSVNYEQLRHAVEESGFQNWSPFSGDDGATGQFYKNLLKRLDMLRWPYWLS